MRPLPPGGGSLRPRPPGLSWNDEIADSRGGPIVCHNDICLENVVFRDGLAVGLLDFDFSGARTPVYDLAQFARMCVPIDDDESAALLGWDHPDKPSRLRLVCDSYGLDRPGRARAARDPRRRHGAQRGVREAPRGPRRAGLRHDVGVDGRPGTLGPPQALVGGGPARVRRRVDQRRRVRAPLGARTSITGDTGSAGQYRMSWVQR